MNVDTIAVKFAIKPMEYTTPYAPGVDFNVLETEYRKSLPEDTFRNDYLQPIRSFSQVEKTSPETWIYRFPSTEPYPILDNNNAQAGFFYFSRDPLEIPPSNLLVIVPGWGEDRSQVSFTIASKILEKTGVPVLVPIPPMQSERTPYGMQSAEGYFHPRVDLSAQNIGHFSSELRSIINFCMQIGVGTIDLAAISAGGFPSNLALSTSNPEIKIRHNITICSGGLLGGIVFDGALTTNLKEGLIAEGIDRPDLVKILTPYDPLFYSPESMNFSGKAISFVAEGDECVPTRYQKLLANHLGSEIIPLRYGHSSLVLQQRKIVNDLINVMNVE